MEELWNMTRIQGFKKIEDKPNFQLVIANSNIEHSTESMVFRS